MAGRASSTKRFMTLCTGIAILSALSIEICTAKYAQADDTKKTLQPAANKPSSEKPAIREKWALLIGVNRFTDPAITGLKYAQKSAADLARALKDPDAGRFPPDHVLLLNGPNATKEGIEAALEQWLYKKALPNDLVLVYISSRLAPSASSKEAVLLSTNSQIADLDKTGINLPQMFKSIKQRVQSNHIICLLDCNPLNKTEKSSEKDLKSLAAEGVTLFSANELFQPSLDDEQTMNSLFSHYLVEVLKGSQGNLPFFVMAEYVHQKVKEDSQSSKGIEQRPSLVLSSPQSQTATVVIGMPTKNFNSNSISVGHPLDKLALERPDILAKNSNVLGASPTGATTAAKPMPDKKPPDEDDDDEKIDHNLDFGSYMSKMKQDIQKQWKAPKGIETRRVITVFTILANGSIANPEIAESSGNAELDQSALTALRTTSLDPLPKGAPKSVDIRYVFDWKSSPKY